ncbi:MAG TPA: neuraminidase-like domain-containing protein [Daejeonella sp.]
MPKIKLSASFNARNKSDVVNLHNALKDLKLEIAPVALSEKKIETSTKEAIKKIQKEFKLPANGKPDEKTLQAINVKLNDEHITRNKYRVANLHQIITKLGIEIKKEEKDNRISGETTREAIREFQKKEGLPADGKLSEEVIIKMQDKVVQNRFYSEAKNQRGLLHNKLQKLSKIAKLDIDIAPDELKSKELGDSSVKLIRAFQEKYRLPSTGKIDQATLEKMESVAASKGTFVKKMSSPPVRQLKVVTKELKVNKTSPEVAEMQKNLAYLGYKIAEKEFKSQTFGRTTIKALKSLQEKHSLAITGHYDKATIKVLSNIIITANPEAAPIHRYRIRGSVRDQLWQRKNEMVIKIFELVLDQESTTPLIAKKNFLNGFFDIPYDAPLNTSNGQIKEKFHLRIKLYDAADQTNPVAIQTHYNVTRIHWVNFTESVDSEGKIHYDGKYKGVSVYESNRALVKKIIGDTPFTALKETPESRLISQLSWQSNLSTDEIMRLVLASLIAETLPAPLSPEVIYAYIAQNLPPDLPGDLLRGTSDWETITQLTELATSGIVFLEKQMQTEALETAINQNIVSQSVKLNLQGIIQALAVLRVDYTLNKPILVGNSNLKTLLDESALKPASYKIVADTFIKTKGINNTFWEEIAGLQTQLGTKEIADFVTVVQTANLTKNHIPTVQFIKSNIGSGKRFAMASDLAKLDQEGIVSLINENGKQVPENMPGTTSNEKVANFAAAIKTRSEFLYPAVSLVATTKRLNPQAISKINEVEKFIDTRTDINFREDNIDKYIAEQGITIDKPTKDSLKLVQRIHKLTTNSVAGSVLIDQKLHSSMQIYFKGRESLAKMMKDKGVDDKQIYRLYEASKFQYMQVIARFTDFRGELHRNTPAAIIPYTFKNAEIQAVLGNIPDLETLFGSLDYCECDHCKSLYGPAAYLTDMLRFLKEHLATNPSKTVKDILFERRPDLGNIKLNCENTNVTLPYIDLVNEILENNLTGNKDFTYQTTLSSKELRAIPENVLPAAYTKLAEADFPMKISFNLWQEEARTYLNYLRVPRYELMETFQNRSDTSAKVPADATIAAEFFQLSSKEKDLITTPRATVTAQNKYWGFTASLTEQPISVFMKRTKLSYFQVLELLMVKFVNDPENNFSLIEREVDTCDTEKQKITNLTPAKLDLMHRFIRLWRKTGWQMWELDLLIRNTKIGGGQLGDASLIRLKAVKQLQDLLRLPVEAVLSFYGELNREVRVQPEKQDVIVQPQYNRLLQNIAVTNPIDTRFRAISNLNDKVQIIDPSLPFGLVELSNTILLGVNADNYTPVPTILSALAISQTDLDLLQGKTNGRLSLNTLSILFRYVHLARGLKLTIPDLLLLLSITNTNDPFDSPLTTLVCLENLTRIRTSGLSLLELDYVLNYKPDSVVGLREETLSQLIEGLRRILEDSQRRILFLNRVLAFQADDLAALTPAPFMTLFSAIQSELIASNTDLSGPSVTAEEIRFIKEFSNANLLLPDGTDHPDAAANKTTLIANIKKVQTSAETHLGEALTLKQNHIKAQVASSFSITTEQAHVLLTLLTIDTSAQSLLQNLENENLIAPQGSGYADITRANFPVHFSTYTLLHKSAILVSRLKIETENLDYFIANRVSLHTLNFSALPLSAAVSPNQYSSWLNLCSFLIFKSKFPEPENSSIRNILDLAKDPDSSAGQIKAAIASLTRWDQNDPLFSNLSALETGLGTVQSQLKQDYTHADLYLRLLKCFDQMRLTGANAATLLSWALIGNDTSIDILIAQQTRQAVKSKYEQDDWLSKITPLHDDLREKKRDALVGYHIDYSQRTAGNLTFGSTVMVNPRWTDPDSLFKYFLIDVEMSACQLTSRIKQALSSVQFFVQRCFLNLENQYVVVSQDEKDDVSSPNAWSQWKWMKNYRLWEANRKIFFYPENWLEPELRDDKSPFFKDLENELLQGEITRERVEAVFLNYLHKVDEVSHLEVCGLYHQMEDLNPDEAGYEVNIIHVVGRTKAMPCIYYYRTYDMNYSTWSAWERIDVDILGDHLVPVVYNRKLHLFWLQFMEKPMKTRKTPAAQPSTGPTDAPEPLKVMEVQLGWTVKKSDGWSPKQISRQKLIHPWERPHHSYNLKPYYLSKFNELYLDIYLSTSKEFNDNKFYDPNKALNPSSSVGALQNPTYLTNNRFNETYLPWHSSAFVFNGDVKDVKLKGLGGAYTQSDGTLVWLSDSHDYVRGNFGPEGQAIKELEPIEFGPRLRLPAGMHFENNKLVNNKVHSANSTKLCVLENGASTTLLSNTSNPFDLVITQQDLQLNTMVTGRPMFYQDNQRAFFIKPEWETRLNNYSQVIGHNRKYRFQPFYHPYTSLFIREFNRDGIDGLLNRKIQTQPNNYSPKNTFNFNSYSPSVSVVMDNTVQKTDVVDFSFDGANSVYNWELFFHAPLMIACRLMQNQKFEDAMAWFHYIFNPTSIDGAVSPQRYWITKPFYHYNSAEYRKERIESILSNLHLKQNSEQLKAWRNHPFNPHIIARYRPVAYQKNVVMKYLDNLIAWGDMLFKRDTIESINEASLLYMLAYEILGDRPQKVPTTKHKEFTFNEIEHKLDDFGNARVDVLLEDTLIPMTVIPSQSGGAPIPKLDMFYFCLPGNEDITKYWDTVEDRLYKIRHCMNIAGVVRQLPLFEPPIDPALLVKAAAAGIDLNSVLNDLAAPTPFYRFRIVVQKAIEFCSEVSTLGEKLLSALEKKDAEKLSLMHSQHEIQLLEAVKEIRKKQIDEAVETVKSLNSTKQSAEEKKSYYNDRAYMNAGEIVAMSLSSASTVLDAAIAAGYIISGGLKLIPSFLGGGAGFGGTPEVSVTMGGQQIGNGAEMAVQTIQSIASALDKGASIASTLGSYDRRQDEWDFQGRLAAIDIRQAQNQINAAEIRQAIAEKELEHQEMQIENAKAVGDYMRNKYTNDQLYNWMITQISTVYFQAYQLAFDMAKKAEKCYQYELGISSSNIVQFGYWDSLKKGLLSGDKLMNDLRRLEAEYINQNKREFEIVKHISLAQVAPLSLITLKETGRCVISLPEWLFDMDYPGHYMRRIKNVSISIPCITGPYTSINCTLSLLRNETRMDATLQGGNYAKADDSDTRFKTMFGAISSIATSHAQNDSGMFELNFNDDRYLPFEGAGVISDWQISLPKEQNHFDFASLSDVILHMSYSSRSGGGQLSSGAYADLQERLPNETSRLFSIKHEFGNEWHHFLNPVGDTDQSLNINLKLEHFPFFIRGRLSAMKIKKLDLFIQNAAGIPAYVASLKVTSANTVNNIAVDSDVNYNNTPHASRDLTADALGVVNLKIRVDSAGDFKSLTAEQIDNIFVLIQLGS